MGNKKLLILLPAILAGCATTEAPAGQTRIGSASLVSATGGAAGSATITADQSGVVIKAEAVGLPAGIHGAHLHMVGKCDGPDFTTAGSHLNPTATQHGAMNPAGPHLGDLPNLTVMADGSGSITATMPGTAETIQSQLFDTDGTALVIHASPDDYRTDPSGNSGARIACGVITRG